MRILEYVLNLASVLILGYLKFSKASTDIYVCESSDPIFLGKYSSSSTEQMDGVPIFSNENDMSFFRNKGFWYAGNLAPWPPETAFRCVEQEGCNYNEAVPPTSTEGVWSAAKKVDSGKSILITHEPCGGIDNEEL